MLSFPADARLTLSDLLTATPEDSESSLDAALRFFEAPMIIHNGDHLEFELKHAETKPEDRPDWPLPSFDARDWAKAFCKINPEMSEDIMLTWFANALMRGFDEGTARANRS